MSNKGTYRGVVDRRAETGMVSVFFIDDHVMVRQGLAAAIDGEYLVVVGESKSNNPLLEQIQQCRPDVVVMDIVGKSRNGLDICRQLAQMDQPPAVLILTNQLDERIIARAIRQGVAGYLSKYSEIDRLVEAILTVAGGQLYLGPGISSTGLDNKLGDDGDPYQKLTARELQVLQLVAEGGTNRQVAEQLGLAIKTVDTHRMRLMRKLDIHDQTTLVKFALREGIVSID